MRYALYIYIYISTGAVHGLLFLVPNGDYLLPSAPLLDHPGAAMATRGALGSGALQIENSAPWGLQS
jgi:hypothetical protein